MPSAWIVEVIPLEIGVPVLDIIRAGSAPSGKGPTDWFTGTVRTDPLFNPFDRERVQGAQVRCTHGMAHPSFGADPTHHLGQRARAALGWRNHRLSVAEAASFCQKLPAVTLDFLEEPIRSEIPGAYQALRQMTDIPFAIGEELASKWAFLPFIEGHIHQFNRLDVCNVGGLTEAMKIAGWSEAHYVDMMPHNPLRPICTAASIHFAAAVPNFSWLETRASPAEKHLGFDNSDFFPVQPKLQGATYIVSDAPELGVKVNDARIARQSFEFWEAPHLRRRDGSYTNW